jgi:hypothetical protein
VLLNSEGHCDALQLVFVCWTAHGFDGLAPAKMRSCYSGQLVITFHMTGGNPTERHDVL